MKLTSLSKGDDFTKTDDLYRKLIASAFAVPLDMYPSRPISEVLNKLSRKYLGYDWFKQDIK